MTGGSPATSRLVTCSPIVRVCRITPATIWRILATTAGKCWSASDGCRCTPSAMNTTIRILALRRPPRLLPSPRGPIGRTLRKKPSTGRWACHRPALASRISNDVRTGRSDIIRTGDLFVAKYQRQPDAQSPAGGVSSSVRDMALWLAMVLQGGTYGGKRIVAQEALLPAVTARIVTDHGTDMTARPGLYGYGFGVGIQPSGRVTMSHSGAFYLGAATNFVLIPSLGLGIHCSQQCLPRGCRRGFVCVIRRPCAVWQGHAGLAAAYRGLVAGISAPTGSLVGKSPAPGAAPPSNLQNYAGLYENDYYGPAEILGRGDGLALRIGPKGLCNTHCDIGTAPFSSTPPTAKMPPDGSVSAITFKVGGSGRASAFSNEFYATSGRNAFVRR